MLAPDGWLIFTTPDVYSLPSLGRFLLGRSVSDPVEEFGKPRNLGAHGPCPGYSAREVVRFLQAYGFVVRSVDYRYDANAPGRRAKALGIAYRLAPRRFHREIVVIARKAGDGPRLKPLVAAER